MTFMNKKIKIFFGHIWHKFTRHDRRLKRRRIKEFDDIRRLIEAHLVESRNRRFEMSNHMFNAIEHALLVDLEHYNTIKILVTADQFYPCLPFARSIVENSINLLYILKEDSERRARAFALHSAIVFAQRTEKETESEAKPKELIETLQQINELQSQNPKSGRNKSHWDGKSFKQLCEELNMQKIYTGWYTRLSGYTHPQYKIRKGINKDGPFLAYLEKLVFRDMFLLVLESIKDLNAKFDLLEGGAMITDYPTPGTNFHFSINIKATNEALKKMGLQ